MPNKHDRSWQARMDKLSILCTSHLYVFYKLDHNMHVYNNGYVRITISICSYTCMYICCEDYTGSYIRKWYNIYEAFTIIHMQ